MGACPRRTAIAAVEAGVDVWDCQCFLNPISKVCWYQRKTSESLVTHLQKSYSIQIDMISLKPLWFGSYSGNLRLGQQAAGICMIIPHLEFLNLLMKQLLISMSAGCVDSIFKEILSYIRLWLIN